MSNASRTKRGGVAAAEKSVLRAAMGIVNSHGWAFQTQGDGLVPVVLFPGSMRRLECAIARLKLAREKAKPRRRNYK